MQTPLATRLVTRITALLVASLAIGVAFNAASPVGIRWHVAQVAAAPAAPAQTPRVTPRPAVTPPTVTPAPVSSRPAAVAHPSSSAAAPARPTVQPPRPTVSTPPAHPPVIGNIYANEPVDVQWMPVTSPAATGNLYSNETIEVTIAPVVPPKPVAVTWAQAKELQAKGAVLVDVRPAAAFQAGAIPGAISLPYTDFKAHLPAFRKRYTPHTWLICYCASDTCAIAEVAAAELVAAGYQHVYHLPGGYVEWQVQEGTTPKPAGSAP